MSDVNELIVRLNTIVGEQCVLTDEADRIFYSMDIWTRGVTAAAVVRPADTAQLSSVVAEITRAGFAVIARGGGMSYTTAYTPVEDNTFIIDCLNMDKIIEINRDDMYVTVEAGCSWKKLHEALKDSGVRTPFWGTLSGVKATVGGSISQGSMFWGSGQYGLSSDSVISMDVIIADGSVVSTGSAAQQNSQPFFRHFGPDLTGIFCCDSGALGIKASVTLRLTPEREAARFAAFNFPDHRGLVNTMAEVSRQGLAMQCCGFDPTLTRLRTQRDSLVNDAKAFAGVLKNSESVLSAIRDALGIAVAGRRFMKHLDWPCYIIIEEQSTAAADHALKAVLAIGKKYGGRVVEPSIPKIIRANPFGPLNNVIGPGGERWVPVHALMPWSKGIKAVEAVQAVFDRHADSIEQFTITTGFLFTTIATNALAIEPVFFWPDAVDDIQQQTVEPSFYNKVNKFEDNLAARNAVAMIRQDITTVFAEMGGVNQQIGKSYPYASGLNTQPLQLVQGIKKIVDPHNRINPQALGLR